ncbi:GNAT family N-acetyltransferase [Vitiosangium sp. GDMCC 1.1324]|uniref:GNAT family N-acetyltransferase n=1 Tax=Vitiosangium sp. (strain GDMCC 1.1324) TaxID=2138576 RepID=UPI000D37CDC4|nr:GNAT family N-acetyltransferase [Vitiosangium sp. GDMCC 1.1324]PTL80881.1 N-acetyltransferase [Vitiosangium sp. GDMCC 1.1324]
MPSTGPRRALDLVVRIATPADVGVLSELGARTFRDTFAADNRPEDMQAYLVSHFSPAHQEQELRDPQRFFLLAESAGTPAGFALLQAASPEPGVPGRRPLHIERLYVDRPFQGVGTGAALMRRCMQEARARGHDVLWLGVWERNFRARAFYARWGFSEVGETSFVLGRDTQRDLVLALPL